MLLVGSCSNNWHWQFDGQWDRIRCLDWWCKIIRWEYPQQPSWLHCQQNSISKDPSFRQKHPGVPDWSDGADRTSYHPTENYTLPVAQATCRVAHVPPLPFGDVYAPSERHVCYTLRKWLQLRWSRLFCGRRFFGNAAGAPGNHSYYLSFNDFQNLCIQCVFSSMYLWIYIATYLHTVYLDWQHAVIVVGYPCISVHPPLLINDVLRGCDRASWGLHLEAEIEWHQRCT